MESGETAKTSQDTAPKDTALENKTSGSTPEKQYTEAEHQSAIKKAVIDALGEQGRKHKAILTATERKAQERITQSIADLKSENEKLQSEIEELSKDDEDKSRLVKLLRANNAKQKELQEKEDKFKQEWEPRIQKAEEWELATLCAEIAGDYEGGDPVKLGRLASKVKFTDGEDRSDQIRELADDLWKKKDSTPKKEEPRKVDSGVTTGTVNGRQPTLAELKASTPEQTEKKVKSGEWVLPGWM